MKKYQLFLGLFFCWLTSHAQLSTPTLSSPVNNATNVAVRPSLEWNTVSGANRYEYQCDLESTFNTPYFVTGTTTSYYATCPALYYGKTYYWRVRACNASDTSAWSTVRVFTTKATLTLTSPSNHATNVAVTPYFEWSTISGSTRYEYQCDTTENFDSPYFVTNTTTGSYITCRPLYYGKHYYWRMRAIDAVDTSDWSEVRDFTTKATLTLTSPSNHATNVAVTPYFEWNTISGSTRYEYQCDTTENFDSPYFVTNTTTGSYITCRPLYYGKHYYWRMRAIDAVDTSEWSEVRDFTTKATLTLTSPSNHATNVAVTPYFEWNTISGSTRYEYQCDTNINFNSPYFVTGTSTSSYVTSGTLHSSQHYYWRMRAIDAVDTSEWSEVREFTTKTSITLVSPANGATVSSTKPQLAWNTYSGCTYYEYQCDTSLNFDSPYFVTGLRTSSYTYVNTPALHYGETYYWRVRAISAVDTTDWSPIWSFTIKNSFSLLYPSNGATVSTTKPQLEWNSFSGGTFYEYQCDTSLNFDSPYFVTGLRTSSYTYVNTPALHYGETYYWRVRVMNEVDTSDWSAIWSFTIKNSFSLLYPSNGATVSTTKPQLEWNSFSGGTYYEYQCDTSLNFDSPYFVTGLRTSSYTYVNTPALHYGETYYWRVRVMNEVDTSDWSAIWSFTIRNSFSLLSPSNGATVSTTKPQLEWNSFSGGTYYEYQCDTSSNFDSPYFVTGLRTSSYTYVTTPALHYGETYYWRVRVMNEVDTSEWSVIWSFTTRPSLNLVSPSNGATVTTLTPQLNWSSYSGGTYYQYQYDVTPLFNSANMYIAQRSYNYATTPSLRYGETYYWRVRVMNEVDTSEWSVVWAFNTQYNLTIAPSLIAPADLSTGIPQDGQLFEWTSLSNVIGYELQYALSNDFADFQSVTTASITTPLQGLLPNTTYYWRVRGYDGNGNSPWSVVWSFNTEGCTLLNDISETACNSFSWDGTTYYQSGDYTHHYESYLGCDSVVTLHLTIHSEVTNEWNESACESYTWDGTTYYQSGDYTKHYESYLGCDSVVTLHLTIGHSVETDFSATDCDVYSWNNEIFTQSGDYVRTLQTAIGCDSIVTLHLTVNHSVTTFIRDTACDVYLYNGNTYTQSGNYSVVFTAANECDSTVILELVINQSYNNDFYPVACDSYTWNGTTYTQSGTYQNLWQTTAGCDSMVTLHLTITDILETTLNISACESYLFNNELLTMSGEYSQTFTSTQGCDSVVTLNLTIYYPDTTRFSETACDSYEWDGEVLYVSGEYTHSYDVAGACDSVAILNLTIVATPEAVISGDSEISAGEFTTLTAEGGDSFSWNTGDTTATITVAPSDTTEYFVVVANDNFCTDTAFFTVNVSTNIAENSLQNCLIYPNPASEYVNVIAEDLETIYIYNAYGQLIQLLTVEQEYNHRVNTSDWAPGIYVLRCVDVMGRVSQSKLVIQHY